jgi:hypothetical protein
MATTTNYGWETADDTDLVKDGALAMRTLGSAIDTTTKALNPSTTLGDIEYRSATANTNTRLAIGSTGDVLTVSGGVPTWAAPASGGGMTLLSTTTLSGSSTSISITPTGYNEIVVIVHGITNGSNGNLFMGINSDTTAANYVQAFYATEGTSYYSGANVGVAGVNAIIPGQVGYLGANNNNIAQFIIEQPNLTTRKLVSAQSAFYSQNSLHASSNSTCNYATSSALSSIQLFTTVGSFTAGTALVYGVK